MVQRIIDRSYVGEVLQRIYTGRLVPKFTITISDGYFYIEYQDQRTPLQGTTIEEAVTGLAWHLSREFPQSQFATWWRDMFDSEDRNL